MIKIVLTGYVKTILKNSMYFILKEKRSHSRKFSIFISQSKNLIKTTVFPKFLSNYSKYKYDTKVEAAVNKQIQTEQQTSQQYLCMAVYFLHPLVGRPGTGGYFMRMYEEELGHMQDFIQYQLLRGGTAAICGLDVPVTKANLTMVDAFKKGLEMEKHIAQVLEALILTAETVKDYQCADYVTSVFLAEQMRSVNEFATHVTKLARLNNEHAFYHYDLQLGKDYPWSYKAKAHT